MHPYRPVPPYVYRIVMPDAGPAAIAVSLPQKLSYCWDAGACRLRYAWQRDFIDPIEYWDKKGERFAKILGTVFYRDKTEFPLRVNEIENIPATWKYRWSGPHIIVHNIGQRAYGMFHSVRRKIIKVPVDSLQLVDPTSDYIVSDKLPKPKIPQLLPPDKGTSSCCTKVTSVPCD